MGAKICSATTVCQALFPWNPAEFSQQPNEGSPIIPIGRISRLSLVTGLVDIKAWL